MYTCASDGWLFITDEITPFWAKNCKKVSNLSEIKCSKLVYLSEIECSKLVYWYCTTSWHKATFIPRFAKVVYWWVANGKRVYKGIKSKLFSPAGKSTYKLFEASLPSLPTNNRKKMTRLWQNVFNCSLWHQQGLISRRRLLVLLDPKLGKLRNSVALQLYRSNHSPLHR